MPRLEAAQLLAVGDREPVFAEHDAVIDQHLLEDRGLLQEAVVLLRRTEAHHLLHAGAVVPGAVEEHDLALAWQVGDVALVVPLAAFPLGWRGQRDDPGDSRAQILGDPLDRATLARRIAALEDHHDAGAGLPRPFLELDQLRLQPEDLGFVDLVGDLWRLLLFFAMAPTVVPVRSGRTGKIRLGNVSGWS